MSTRVIVVDHRYNDWFCQWITERIGEPGQFNPDECRTIAHMLVHDDGTPEILCVVAFNRWTAHTCEGSIASDGTKRWMSREFAFTVYDYAFRHADKSRLNFTVRADNTAAITMHEKLGHEFVCRLTDAHGEGKDAFIYGLTRKQWKKGRWAAPNKETLINTRTEEENNGRKEFSTSGT